MQSWKCYPSIEISGGETLRRGTKQDRLPVFRRWLGKNYRPQGWEKSVEGERLPEQGRRNQERSETGKNGDI